MDTGAKDCEDDRRKSKQQQSAYLSVALDMLRSGGCFVRAVPAWVKL
jgi:hypothetical protein